MKKLLFALSLFLAPSLAWGQCNGIFPGSTVCGNSSATSSTPFPVPFANIPTPSIALSLSTYNASGSGQTTTGTISSGSSTLTLASAIDFKNTQYVLVNHAGATFTGTAPTGVTVVQNGVTGSTSYSYQIACVDGSGGIGAATIPVQITNGNAVTSIDNSISLSWTAGSGCVAYVIWKQTGAGTYVYLGSVTGTTKRDSGSGGYPVAVPFWVPSTPTASALSDWLVTAVTSGAGTTTLTLQNAASTSVSGVAVLHDDTIPWNNWIAALNASPGSVGIIPPNYTVRLSSPGALIIASNTAINGNNANIIPAGAGDNNAPFNAQGGGIVNGGTVEIPEGSTTATLSSTTGFSPGLYLAVTQPTAGSQYAFTVPVISLSGSTATLGIAAPVRFYANSENGVITGTPAIGDTYNITATSGSITGSPVTISYTVISGDTNISIAHKLAINFNANTNIATAGITAIDNEAGTVRIGVPSSISVTWSQSVVHSGGGSGVITLSNVPFATFNWRSPLIGTNISNIRGDGSNVVGFNYDLIFTNQISYSRFTDITGKNFAGGAVISSNNGFANVFRNITAISSGNDSTDSIGIVFDTASTANTLTAIDASGFGVGIDGSWLTINGITAKRSWGRNVKFGPLVQGTITNITADSSWGGEGTSLSTNIAFAWGTYKVTLNGCAISNAGNGLWFSDEFNSKNSIFNCTFANNILDVANSASDTNNTIYSSSPPPSIFNLADFTAVSAVSGVFNIITNQPVPSQIGVINTNSSNTAYAQLYTQSNAGSIQLNAFPISQGSIAQITSNLNNLFFIDSLGASGAISIRTGPTPTAAINIDSSQNVTLPVHPLGVASGGTNCAAASGTCLDNITAFSSTGLLTRTAAGTYVFRTITGTANQITLANGNGVSSNPTISLPSTLGGIAIIGPGADSTTAFKLTKADLATAIMTVDTTNARIGINKTPGAFALDISGATNISSALNVGSTLTVATTGVTPMSLSMDNSFFMSFSGNQNSSLIGMAFNVKDAVGAVQTGFLFAQGGVTPSLTFLAPGSTVGNVIFGVNNGSGGTLESFRVKADQTVQFASPSIVANGAVATALTAVGPTGSHTTVQEWLQIRDSIGTIRYIPLF